MLGMLGDAGGCLGVLGDARGCWGVLGDAGDARGCWGVLGMLGGCWGMLGVLGDAGGCVGDAWGMRGGARSCRKGFQCQKRVRDDPGSKKEWTSGSVMRPL
jgi:hypothetical protein